MVKTVLLIMALVIAAPVFAQSQEVEHAPTVAQCQADQRLWYSTLEGNHDAVLTSTLQAWEAEMLKCTVVDPDHYCLYVNTQSEANALEAFRYEKFLSRHHLREQFDAEEAAGAR